MYSFSLCRRLEIWFDACSQRQYTSPHRNATTRRAERTVGSKMGKIPEGKYLITIIIFIDNA